MGRVERVDETNKQCVVDYLRTDIVRHAFAYYDIRNDPDHTTTHVEFDDGNLIGYILTYTATDVPSTILESDNTAVAERLIRYAPQDNFIMHVPPNLLTVIQKRFPDAKHYVEDWMLARQGEATSYKSNLVRPLCPEESAAQLAELLSTRRDRPERAAKRFAEWFSRNKMYGVFADGALLSCAGSLLQTSQIWIVGGVYTHPDHRNKGYSTVATSAITEDALANAEAVALFVRSDNHSAIRVYEKIGYKKIGEKVWVDIGTGLRP